jgi:hypothetical protein
MPVFLKPLVRNEMSSYISGHGHKREWRKYNKSLNVTKLQLLPKPADKTLTFRGLVKSEEKRDIHNSTGPVKNSFSKKLKKKGKHGKHLFGKHDKMVRTRVKVKQKNGIIKYKYKMVAVKRAKDKTRDENGDKIAKQYVNYLVTLQFHEMEYEDKTNRVFNQPWMIEGKARFTRTPAISIHPAKLKCQCRDFMFVWEKALAEKDGLWPNNKWTKYIRLTSLAENPPRNPMEKMGYCKHVATMIEYLNQSKLLRNT